MKEPTLDTIMDSKTLLVSVWNMCTWPNKPVSYKYKLTSDNTLATLRGMIEKDTISTGYATDSYYLQLMIPTKPTKQLVSIKDTSLDYHNIHKLAAVDATGLDTLSIFIQPQSKSTLMSKQDGILTMLGVVLSKYINTFTRRVRGDVGVYFIENVFMKIFDIKSYNLVTTLSFTLRKLCKILVARRTIKCCAKSVSKLDKGL